MAIVSHAILFSNFFFYFKIRTLKQKQLLCSVLHCWKIKSLVERQKLYATWQHSDGRRDAQNPSKTRSPGCPRGHSWQGKKKLQKCCGCHFPGPTGLLLWRLQGILYKRWACLVLGQWAFQWKDLGAIGDETVRDSVKWKGPQTSIWPILQPPSRLMLHKPAQRRSYFILCFWMSKKIN